MNKGKLFVLSAPSGTGKTTILKTLLKNNPKWKFSVSATNRAPREGEVDGKDYIYMSNEKFDHAVKFGDFLEKKVEIIDEDETPAFGLETVIKIAINGVVECK